MHVRPQAPQFGELLRTTHVLSQTVSPMSQYPHWPLLQLLGWLGSLESLAPWQMLPHVPQLVASDVRFLQPSLQQVMPGPQPLMHMPPQQTWPAAHGGLPHPPQLLESVPVSVQVPPQLVWPGGHTQELAAHTIPPVHAVPHTPQLLGSDVRSTQSPVGPQAVLPGRQAHVAGDTNGGPRHTWPVPGAHCKFVVHVHVPASISGTAGQPHVPFEHTWLVLGGHCDVSVQPQSGAAAGQPQTLAEHSWPNAHVIPHPPQLAASVCRSVHAGAGALQIGYTYSLAAGHVVWTVPQAHVQTGTFATAQGSVYAQHPHFCTWDVWN
jgi:hypothetical protein